MKLRDSRQLSQRQKQWAQQQRADLEARLIEQEVAPLPERYSMAIELASLLRSKIDELSKAEMSYWRDIKPTGVVA